LVCSSSCDEGLVAKAAVAPKQLGTLLGAKLPHHVHQARACFSRAVFFAGGDNHIEHLALVSYPVGVQCDARPAGFVRVVADLVSLLFAVQGFDGGVDVQYPVRVQCGLHAGHELGCEPVLALLMILFMPSICGLTASERKAVMCA